MIVYSVQTDKSVCICSQERTINACYRQGPGAHLCYYIIIDIIIHYVPCLLSSRARHDCLHQLSQTGGALTRQTPAGGPQPRQGVLMRSVSCGPRLCGGSCGPGLGVLIVSVSIGIVLAISACYAHVCLGRLSGGFNSPSHLCNTSPLPRQILGIIRGMGLGYTSG